VKLFRCMVAGLIVGQMLVTAVPATAAPKSASPFRLHIAKEPSTLDPHLQNSSGASYVLQNLYRNIFVYHTDKGLQPDLGESCKRTGALRLTCKLKKNLKWSDGTALTAEDFVASYKRLLDPKEGAPRADQLFKIKNAEAIFKGQKKMGTLGIQAMDATTLRFEFEEKDPEFEYALSNYLLSPVKITPKAELQKSFSSSGNLPGSSVSARLVANGPYKLAEWAPGEKLVLINNPHYNAGKNAGRPPVEILFIPEDSVALQLYEKKQLSFLRRLPTLYIPTYKTRPDFLWIPLIRFDYIGFGPALKDDPAFREALTYSLHYPELQKLFSSEGMPGCPGIPKEWQKKELCYKFDLARAKAAFAKVIKPAKPLQFLYSVLGGEDHRRSTEWLQSQWQTNLGLSVQTAARDNKVFLAELSRHPPALFRKGATPDRPTCLAALETFAENSPENYLKIAEPAFQQILKKLSEATSKSESQAVCSEGLDFLMSRHLLIPTGPIHFAMLASKDFVGWEINNLNQLDLAELKEQNKE
jgi:oligopeptide transport system substrate-binding protein